MADHLDVPIRLLALDLDGTLVVEGNDISPATRDALAELHEGDVEVVIATGRRYRTTHFVIENLGFPVYAVCSGGALIKQKDTRSLHQFSFSAGDVDELLRLARAGGVNLFGQRDSFDLGGPDFIIDDHTAWNPHTQNYFDINQPWSQGDDLAKYRTELLSLGLFDKQQALESFKQAVTDRFEDRFNLTLVPNPDGTWYCEINLGEVDKWRGLSVLAQHLALTPAQICVAGDQVNDLSMIKAAPHAFVMANGTPELHEFATAVVGRNDEDGLLEVVQYIEDHNQQC